MRRLILFRHAKSAWGDPGLADHDRPLSDRGRLAASLMGAYLADQGLRPDRVLVSSSVRTIETWRLARRAFDAEPDIEVAEALYHADPASMLAVVQALPETVETAMVIGHNPGLAAFARKLANEPVRPACARAFEKFPTGAVAVFEADVAGWPALEFGGCAFTRFATPKDLI